MTCVAIIAPQLVLCAIMGIVGWRACGRRDWFALIATALLSPILFYVVAFAAAIFATGMYASDLSHCTQVTHIPMIGGRTLFILIVLLSLLAIFQNMRWRNS